MKKFYPKANDATSVKRKSLFYKSGLAGKFLNLFFIVIVLLSFAPENLLAQIKFVPDDGSHWIITPFNTDSGTIQIKVVTRFLDPVKNRVEYINNARIYYSTSLFPNVESNFVFFQVNAAKNVEYTIDKRYLTIAERDSTSSNYGTYYWKIFTIYVINDYKDINKISISGTWQEGQDDYQITSHRDIKIPEPGDIEFADPTFFTRFNHSTNTYEPVMKVGYKKTMSALDNASKMQIMGRDKNGNYETQWKNVSSNFTYDTIMLTGFPIMYREGAYFNGIENSARMTSFYDIKIPPFELPLSATSTYDTAKHKVTFTWKMDPVAAAKKSYAINTDFHIQMSSDPAFTDVVEKIIRYNSSDASFSYTPNINQNLSPKMYFRVSRDYDNPRWKMWDVAQNTEIDIPFVSLSKDSTSDTLQEDKTALVKWKVNGYAWLPGSSFILTKLNKTTGTQTDITLGVADFDKGFYIDKLIATCNEYHYTLQVKPPTGSLFTAYPAVDVKGSVLNPDIGKLLSMTASKGYFPGRTQLNWQAKGAFDNFIIMRALYGTNNYVQISTVPGTTDGSFEFDDEKGVPGVYYSYLIRGMIKCNQKSVYSTDTLRAIGFRSPIGNIHGRVVYKNGQSVPGAGIRLQSEDASQFGKSIYLNGSDTSYLSVDSISPISDITTIEAWIKPDDAAPSRQVIISRSGQFELGFNAAGNLYFDANGSLAEGTYKNDNQSFIHVAGVRTPDSVKILVNDSVIAGIEVPLTNTSSPAKNLLIGGSDKGKNFKGFIDEMLIWNTALSDSIIALNYDRIITGGEKNLAAYWRFDESIKDQFYDQSHDGINYHKNDGVIHPGAWHTDTIPTPGQLSFKAYTDTTGNYMISGIPYTGNGTIYQVVPTFSTHQFDPVSDSRFISENTTDFTVDFTDKSSFPVSGTIYYVNTTVPVQGVNFLIDGQYAQNSDGSLMQTGDDGNFTITVPVGVHRVQAAKSNHVFVNHGDILDLKGNYVNYQGSLAGIKLRDSTTIRFVGRVTGGAIQAALPLGYSISKNNLGKDMAIIMKLSGGASTFSLNDSNNLSQVIVPHKQLSGPGAAGQVHETTVDYYKDRIVIHPDALTGEFAADVIPQKFYTDNVTATGWGKILSDKVQFDFTNKFIDFNTAYTHTDSVYKDASHPDLGYTYKEYTDYVSYNDSTIFVKREPPSFTIVQTDDKGNILPYFGDSVYEYQLINGTNIANKIIDLSKPAKDIYLLGRPVFQQNLLYHFTISSFESYPYYEIKDGVPTRTDIVPVTDGKININNELQAGATGTKVLQLNESGEAAYSFKVGDPDLSDAKQSFSATLQIGQTTSIPWAAYDGGNKMLAYNAGSKSTGNDFVTQGPIELITILRDPPGSRSFSYLEKGSTFNKSISYSTKIDLSGDETGKVSLGPKIVTWLGVGGGVNTEIKTTLDFSLKIAHEEHRTESHGTTITNTIVDRYQTSDKPAFVGELGDVFVGNSTNIIYGVATSIIIVNKNTDSIRVDDQILDQIGDYAVVKRTSLGVGKQFGTLFAFTQQYIEYQEIPHSQEFIRGILNRYPQDLDATEALAAADRTNSAVYISHLPATDTSFGKANTDTRAFGSKAAADNKYFTGPSYTIYFPKNSTVQNDTIMTMNQSINKWTEWLATNESEKVNSTWLQNYSFHAGSPIQYSKQMESSFDTSGSFSFIVSGTFGTVIGGSINGVGVKVKLNESVGGGKDTDSSFSNGTTINFGFTLASDGTDDYFSVDVKKPENDRGLVFITRGGESACPYEGGSVTKYYNPGTPLNEPTVQIEVPKFDVDTHEVDNVPSSRPAVFNLTLRNESDAKLPATYILGYVDNNSIKGATIAVDGLSIAGAGRPIVVKYGEEVQKILTITKGPNALNYDSIMIIWHSTCQYDPTSYLKTIGDTQVVAAHFIPSCTDISLSAPEPNWILNTKSPFDTTDVRFLPITIDKFDTTNPLFDHIVLQYKPSSSDVWQPAATFYPDSAALKAAPGSDKYLITDPAAIHYSFDMNNTFFPDQGYDLQAISVCATGLSTVVTLSDIVSGIKDTTTPRQFGNTQPANGVLGASDEIKLTLNEPIEGGLLNNNNFQVTGVKNLSQGDHSVSVTLDGENDYLSTEFAKNFTGKSITAEMWIRPNGTTGGTLFSQGNSSTSMELTLTSDKHLQVTIGNKTIKSDNLNFSSDWAHVALVYSDVTKTVSAFYNFIEVIKGASVEPYTGTGQIEFGRSVKNNKDFFKGEMHEARIWSRALTFADLQVNSLTSYSGGENGLLAYYPMNEGKGTIAYDKANGSNATLTGNWTTPPGRAVVFKDKGYLRLNSSAATISSTMNYTIELWFKGEAGQKDATLASNGKGDGSEIDGSRNLFFLGFEDGLLTYKNNGFKMQANGNYLDNNWHQVAVTVDHNAGSAAILVDGQLKKYVEAANPGGIASPYIYLGVRAWADKDSIPVAQFDRYFKGSLDEFRLWDTYLNQTLIDKNNNVHLKADEFGLKLYYPFETYTTSSSGIISLDSSWQDMTANGSHSYALGANASYTDITAPIKNRGPVSNLNFNYVVNNDAVIINLLEQKSDIDKTIVTFSVRDALDKNGNAMASPVTWTAYINQNPLQWSDDELNLSKETNKPMEFVSYVINNGGSNQKFTISNLPKWMSADITSGELAPLGKQKITFTINERINTGAYNEVVYLRNNDNQTDGLSINLNVRGKQPAWSVDPGAYKYNMAVYGKIRINNIFSASNEDILGVFFNGKCVGVTNNTYNSANDLWYAFLTVYSNRVNHDSLEFRIWEAATGKTYLAIPAQQISFSNDAITGSPSSPVIFDAKVMLYQDIGLNKGWNWISYNVKNPAFSNVNATLSNGNWSSGDIVKNNDVGFDQYSSTSGWLGYMPGFTNTAMYMLSTANEQTLSMLGMPVDVGSTAISLKGGKWSYISYLPGMNLTVKQALAGYNPTDGDVIKSQTGFAMYNTQNGWIGSLTYLQPGKGYMFYRKGLTDTSFYYPAHIDPLNGLRAVNDNSTKNIQTSVPGNFSYANNLTMIAVIEDQYKPLAGDIVFANSLSGVKGQATIKMNNVTNKEALFFNIAGDEEEPVYFTIQRNKKIIGTSDVQLFYHADSRIGTLEKPFIIHLNKNEERINAYPNPFYNSLTITVDVPAAEATSTHDVQVSIYNSNGALIVNKDKDTMRNGHYQTQWNGNTGNGQFCAAGIYFINVIIDGKLKTYKIIKN
ncbi:MAG: LamG-like jellyroll fold domain-containing protein [Ginsengibacter sp.]